MKGVIISGIIIAAAIGIVVYFITADQELTKANEPPPEFEWKNSGPFSIIDKKYRLGDKVFVTIEGLRPNDAGYILFTSPEGIIANKQPFNGSQKSGFNTYWEPDTSVFTKLYEVKQLVGNWSLVFNGTNYETLQFEVINEYVRGAEAGIFDLPRPQSQPIGPPQKSNFSESQLNVTSKLVEQALNDTN